MSDDDDLIGYLNQCDCGQRTLTRTRHARSYRCPACADPAAAQIEKIRDALWCKLHAGLYAHCKQFPHPPAAIPPGVDVDYDDYPIGGVTA